MSPVRVAALMLTAAPVCAANPRLPKVKLTPPALNTFFDGSQPKPPASLVPPGALPPSPSGRLPRSAAPLRYDVHLTVDPEAGTFAGRVRIEFEAAQPFSELTLNALDLSILRAAVDGREARVERDDALERVKLNWDGAVEGRGVVELEYAGRMNPLMRGLYQARGRDKRAGAFTHLEPTHARRIVPSFDEPDLKAPFSLTVTAPAGLTVLSNMPAEETRVEDNGWTTTRFEETPRMSTYLLSVTAANLVATRRGRVAAWTQPGDERQTGFALDVAEQALKRLELYFGEPYTLPKLDLITAPEFASGAMENWGAVLFRDAALLIDDELSSSRAKRRVAEVVTHEIVHQWFGNLVTMKWWDDLWLNEAFATWLASKMVDKWKPEWNVWLEFERGRREALALDALRGTRQVKAQASTPAEIQAMFDPLTYEKGGAILRMLEKYVGEPAFRDGLRRYMKKYRFGNATDADLWAELGVGEIARGWLNQPGYPMVSARVKGRTITLAQTRFTADGIPAPGQWQVPIVLRYKLKGDKRTRTKSILLTEPSATLELPRGVEWAYPNAGAVGFYRVDAKAPVAALPELERAAYLQDLWAQVQARQRPLRELLETLESLKDDQSPLILEDVAALLQTLSDKVVSERDRPAFERLARRILEPHAKRLGWKSKKKETEAQRLARAAVQSAYAELVDGAPAAARWGTDLEPLLMPVALTAAARRGDEAFFEQLRGRMATAATPEQRDQLMRALFKFRDPALLERALSLTLTDEIRAQDAWKPFVWAFADAWAKERAFAFVKRNWAALVAKLGPRGANRIIASSGSLSDPEDVRRFFDAPENRVELARKSLEQAVEAATLSSQLRRAQGRWLK